MWCDVISVVLQRKCSREQFHTVAVVWIFSMCEDDRMTVRQGRRIKKIK